MGDTADLLVLGAYFGTGQVSVCAHCYRVPSFLEMFQFVSFCFFVAFFFIYPSFCDWLDPHGLFVLLQKGGIMSTFLMGCYDEKSKTYKTCVKVSGHCSCALIGWIGRL